MEKFIDYFNQFLVEQNNLVGYSITPNTYKTYTSRSNNFKEFLESQNCIDLNTTDVTIRTIRSFDTFLRTKKRYCNDYIMRNIQMVKRMLEFAIEDNLITYNPAKLFKFKYERTQRKIFLDLNQLKKLKSVELPNEDLRRNRDIFLFGCYTGFSYCDIKKFNKKSIVKGKDGTNWLNIVRQKTKVNNDTLLPLLSGAMEILDRYGYDLPVSANSNMNRRLKKISKLAGFDIPLSTHSGRKTFGNILVNDFGVDIKTVSVMMGHKSLQTTESWYVDVREKKIARDMLEVRSANW